MKLDLNSPKIPVFMEKTFLFVGRVLVIFLVVNAVVDIGSFRKILLETADDPFYSSLGQPQRLVDSAFTFFFNFLSSASIAAFAFLMSAVFLMVRTRKPDGLAEANKTLLICCGAYVGQSVIANIQLLIWMAKTLPHLFWENQYFNWLSFVIRLGSVLGTFVSNSVPLLYAAAIYVLFRHFAALITFESEVA